MGGYRDEWFRVSFGAGPRPVREQKHMGALPSTGGIIIWKWKYSLLCKNEIVTHHPCRGITAEFVVTVCI
jgi:hypothetical protein